MNFVDAKERFRIWMNAKYEEWRKLQGGFGQEASVTRFAQYVNIERSLMDNWLRGKKAPRDHETVSKLVTLWGLEPLVILEYILPSEVKDPVTRQLLDDLGISRLEE